MKHLLSILAVLFGDSAFAETKSCTDFRFERLRCFIATQVSTCRGDSCPPPIPRPPFPVEPITLISEAYPPGSEVESAKGTKSGTIKFDNEDYDYFLKGEYIIYPYECKSIVSITLKSRQGGYEYHADGGSQSVQSARLQIRKETSPTESGTYRKGYLNFHCYLE